MSGLESDMMEDFEYGSFFTVQTELKLQDHLFTKEVKYSNLMKNKKIEISYRGSGRTQLDPKVFKIIENLSLSKDSSGSRTEYDLGEDVEAYRQNSSTLRIKFEDEEAMDGKFTKLVNRLGKKVSEREDFRVSKLDPDLNDEIDYADQFSFEIKAELPESRLIKKITHADGRKETWITYRGGGINQDDLSPSPDILEEIKELSSSVEEEGGRTVYKLGENVRAEKMEAFGGALEFIFENDEAKSEDLIELMNRTGRSLSGIEEEETLRRIFPIPGESEEEEEEDSGLFF